ncbi:toll-like receptor 2 [Mizuhopecten yessoensis]|nr:toll-like receptor 2 [Mizuhopecten yessoensis]
MQKMDNYLQLVMLNLLSVIALSSGRPCKLSTDKRMADCSNRGFDHIPHLSNLTEGLDLSGNKLSLLDKSSFLNLPNLQSLNLNWNEIKFIGKDTFSGLPALQDLSLGHNHINIVQQTFSQIRFTLNTKLKYLDLSYNTNLPLDEEALYPDSVFASLMSLQELYIDLLPNPMFGTGFSNMTKLDKLVFKDCTLMHLKNDTFINFRNIESLTYLDMSNCHVNDRYFVKIEKAFLQHFSSLQYLDLSRISITFPVAMDILYGLTATTNQSLPVRKMKVLNLYKVNPLILLWMYDVNSTVKVTKEMTQYYRQLCVEDIDLGNNGIVEIAVGTLESFVDFSCLRRISFSENNFLFTFPRFAQSILTFFEESVYLEEFDYSYVAIKFSHGIKESPKVNGKQLRYLPEPQRQSSFRCVMPLSPGPHMRFVRFTHLLFPFFIDCDLDMSRSPTLYLLDISHTTISSTDFRILGVRVEYMNVSGVDFATSGRMLLGNMEGVHKLVIQNANLDRAFSNKNYIFKDIKQLDEVDISSNHLSILEEESVQGLEGVTHIDLSWNFFNDFPAGLYILPNLTNIDLRNNKLNYIRKKAMTWLDMMDSRPEHNIRILMYGNPFACTCDTLEFVFWIYDTNVMLDHHTNYTCVLPNGSIAMLRHVNDNYQLFLGNCNHESFLIVFAISGMSILLLFLVISSFLFKYRWKVQYFFWRKFKKQETAVDNVRQYTFKSFFVISEDDCWSRIFLLPQLEQFENEHNIRVCWQERNFSHNKYQLRQLSEFLPDSEKLVFVITEHFIADNWCEFVLNTCVNESVTRKSRDCLVMLFIDLDFKRVPEYVTSAYKYCKTIKYPEEENDRDGFWNEIRQTILTRE